MLKLQTTGSAESWIQRTKSRRVVVFIALVLTGLAAIPNSALCANSDPLAALIERNRVATGPGLDKVRSIYFAGTIDAGGIHHTFQSWTDRISGRYSIVTDTGPSSWSEGYDGNSAWWRDSKGIVLPQTGPAAKSRTAIGVFGFGGRSRGARGTLASFQMGPVTLTNVDAAFSSDQRGGLANPWLTAIVGNQVWSRFALTFDYARATMVLAGGAASDAH